MTVGDLRQHLAALGRLLEASGAKSVGSELQTVGDKLAPFQNVSLVAFSDFLVRAEAFSRGEVPIVVPRPAQRGPGKQPSPGIEPLAREAEDIYERSATPDVTVEQIESFLARLAPLAKSGLITIAERIGLKGMGSKTKPDIQAAIRRRIQDRKGASIRATMGDRPG